LAKNYTANFLNLFLIRSGISSAAFIYSKIKDGKNKILDVGEYE